MELRAGDNLTDTIVQMRTDTDSALVTLSSRHCKAVLFDLDGVLTRTAHVHAQAWKKLFDDFLEERSRGTGEAFIPFDLEIDYKAHVDGKPREEGVAAFLAARGINLAPGTDADGSDVTSIQGLGSRKDRYFQELIEQRGVEIYEPAIALVHALRAKSIKTAVVSSSKNCVGVLAAVGIAELFDERVDGRDLAQLGLRGKPAPDAFLEAARRLGVEPALAVVIEDAVVGVEAGRAGGFGRVIGVDRGGQASALRNAGADAVVLSLAEVTVSGEAHDGWIFTFDSFVPQHEGRREALCTLGNGYFATRGAFTGAVADDIHYPGTYLAGGYNRLRTEIDDQAFENEDLVNLPNWLELQFRFNNDDWFDLRHAKAILHYEQRLDLARGVLTRSFRFEENNGHRTGFTERRLVSMDDMHRAAIEVVLIAENWSGEMTIRSGIDGRVVNAGAHLYRRFANKHLEPVAAEEIDGDGVLLSMRTSNSNIEVAQAASTRLFLGADAVAVERLLISESAYIAHEMTVPVRQGQAMTVEKLVSLFTSRDQAIAECKFEAARALLQPQRFAEVLAPHLRAWTNLWNRFDIRIALKDTSDVEVPLLLRLNMFHLLQTVSIHSVGLDIGVPARGWTGEAYQGHIFWDELFIFPFFNYRMPEITRSLLMYRYRRLDEARIAADRVGMKGAMFPWQSGSNGQEVTQLRNLNPRSMRWVPDHSHLQRHVGSAIAYNVWQYFQITNDTEFLEAYGAELILEIARFWSSMASFNGERERYEIHGVMGPDEYHEAYPDASQPGLNNNAYTNVMAVWVLCRALDVLSCLSPQRREELTTQLGIDSEELSRWEDISRRMFVPIRGDAIVEQFEGYDGLRELDWKTYLERYANIQRLDLILEAEGDSANNYKLSKQPDVLMLFYLFSADEVHSLLERLGYAFGHGAIPRNVDYYDRRTSQGSTLSRVVHAWVLARSDRSRAAKYFGQALQSDVSDIQQGTTAEGIHLGAMAGTVDLLERATTGIEAIHNVLRLSAKLPPELERLGLRIRYRGHSLEVRMTQDELEVKSLDPFAAPIHLNVANELVDLAGGATCIFKLQ